MAEKKKKKRWMYKRHKLVRDLVNAVMYPYSKIKYGIDIRRIDEKPERQYFILFNHQTAFDQFFVGMAFKQHLYYVASEDLFSDGFTSSLIKYLVAPIPIKKQSTDVRAVMNCMRVAKEGGSIAMAPEGNRTYSGKTEYINPAVAPLARKLGLPIVLYHIEGGYGVHPRWADDVRRGSMNCFVKRIIEPQEYAEMSDAELLSSICEGLYVNEASTEHSYKSKTLAERMERAFYYCPHCGFSSFKTQGDIISCTKCNMTARYNEDTSFTEVSGGFPYKFPNDWYMAQADFVNSLDTRTLTGSPIYTETASIFEVIPYEKKIPIADSAAISLYGDRITLEYPDNSECFSFEDVSSIAVLGKNKLNIYKEGRIYQIKGSPEMNAIKYVNVYYRHKNILKGQENGKFLGL